MLGELSTTRRMSRSVHEPMPQLGPVVEVESSPVVEVEVEVEDVVGSSVVEVEVEVEVVDVEVEVAVAESEVEVDVALAAPPPQRPSSHDRVGPQSASLSQG
jgi:hypothetical protein